MDKNNGMETVEFFSKEFSVKTESILQALMFRVFKKPMNKENAQLSGLYTMVLF